MLGVKADKRVKSRAADCLRITKGLHSILCRKWEGRSALHIQSVLPLLKYGVCHSARDV